MQGNFTPMMEIKNISGKVLLSVPVTDSAVIIEELMKQYSITLNWDAIENVELPLGAYIEHKNIKYSLLAPYQPQQRDEVTFEYKPEFQHPVMRWQYLPFLFYTYSNDTVVSKEPDWSLTDNAANFMAVLCDVIKEQTGEDWTYEVADNLPASASLSFSNKDIFSALNDIANAFETEWWFDYTNKVLYLSKASHGTEVALEVGNNISVPSVTQSKEGYYTRFLVFGSTRNIEQEYKGANTNSIVNKRLTLNPTKYPDGYIDIRNGLTNEEILTKTLVFDDIYPRSELTISDVKVALKWRLDDNDEKIKIGTDAEGNPVYDQYAVWYFKIPNFKYNEDLVIPNKPLSVHFSDGPLQGREFELWHEDEEREDTSTDGTAIRVEKGDYRIKYIEEGSYIIPSITGLVPVDGNKVTLFNILMPEEYKTSAYEELENAAQEEIAKQSEDMSNYSFSSNPVEFFTSNPNLTVGQKVTYKNGNYSYSTRVIKLETQLDRPYEQKITIGNEQIKGNTQTLKEEVVNANQNIDLISAINESTQQLVQSYQRTQKALQESMAKWGNMWRLDAENNAVYTPLNMIVEGTLSMGDLGQGGSETPVAGLQKVSITIPNYDSPFVSDAAGNVTLPAYPTALKNPYALKINGVTYDGSKEISINIEGGGGIADSVAWENVMGRPTKLSEFENDVPYATQKWVTDKGYLTSHQDISHLLSKQDAVTTYATITSLNAISDSLGNLRTEFDALNTLLNDDTSGVIDTWNEVVAFLNGYADSQDLATILSGMNTEIGKRAYQTDLDAAVSRIQTIENAYVDKASDQTITGVKTFQNGLKIGDVKLEWDSTNQALKIIGNAYVTELFSVGKISDSGSGGGGTASAAVRIMLGETPYDAVNGVVNLPAYPSLAGYATESWVNNKGYITGITSTMVTTALGYTPYNSANFTKANIKSTLGIADWALAASKPSYSWSEITGKPTFATVATSGKYSDLSGVPTSLPASDVYAWAKKSSLAAADVPNLDWSKITSGKPTTVLGYGITDVITTNGFSLRAINDRIWGTLTSANGYTTRYWLDSVSGGGIGISDYADRTYIQIDGEYYANEGKSLVLHTANYSNYVLPLSGGTLEGALQIGTNANTSYNYLRLVRSTHYAQINNTGAAAIFSFGDYTSGATTQEKAISIGDSGINYIVDNSKTYPILHSNNYADYALPLSGGTIKGAGSGILTINRTSGNPLITFQANGTNAGFLGINTLGNPIYVDATTYADYPLLHTGNIKSYALFPYTPVALNQNHNLNDYVKGYYGYSNAYNPSNSYGDNTAVLALQSARGIDTWQIAFNGNNIGSTQGPDFAIRGNFANNGWTVWHRIATTSSNVASATKLQTARTIWGQSFDGTGNVDGQITIAGYGALHRDDSALWVNYGGSNYDKSLRFCGHDTAFYYGKGENFTRAITIANTGNVLIGTTTDSGAKLQVNGDVMGNSFSSNPNDYFTENNKNIPWYGMSVVDGYNKGVYLTGYSAVYIKSAYAYMRLDYNGLYVSGNLTVSGGATFGGDVWTEGTMAMAKLASSSDAKLKENIKWLSADKSMQVVRALRPTEWNWKKDNTHSFGFIAQDVQPIVPEMVSSINDTLRLEYNQLHAFEIGAIQHIDSEVEQLKRDLKTANNKIEVLENQLNEYRRNAQWQ